MSREPFIKIEKRWVDSPQFDALPGSAVKLYLKLQNSMFKRNPTSGQWQNCNPDHITFSHSQAKNTIAHSKFHAAMQSLIDAGFIDLIDSGGFPRRPTVYALSNRWMEKPEILNERALF